jgi:hypothetical protein
LTRPKLIAPFQIDLGMSLISSWRDAAANGRVANGPGTAAAPGVRDTSTRGAAV